MMKMSHLQLSVCYPTVTPSPYPHILVTIRQNPLRICYLTTGFYQLIAKNFQQTASEGYKKEVALVSYVMTLLVF